MAAPPEKRARTESKDEFFTNALRCLCIDMVQEANSGHPGAPMGMGPLANVLFSEFLKFDASDPHWLDHDRFVLSNGHASSLQYALLHLCGYNVTMDDLRGFRQWGSITPGHPERGVTPGIEVTTGPLGQGLANAVGLAVAEAHLAAKFNKPNLTLFDHYTFCFCGDGCLMEGVGQEALSLAGVLELSKLIIVYDDNKISIDGSTDLAFKEDSVQKYKALNFEIFVVEHGDTDYDGIRKAILAAKSSTLSRPKMIILKTTIGCGALKQGTEKVHGSPLGKEEVARVKQAFGRDPTKKFYVEDSVYAHFRDQAARGKEQRDVWDTRRRQYREAFPELSAQLDAYVSGTLPQGWKDKLPRNDGKASATRSCSGNTLTSLFSLMPQLVGGSADLSGSNCTRPDKANLIDFTPATRQGTYLRFGVREHAMCAICNGIDAHGGLRAFGATFLNFFEYAGGTIRLSAMSHHGVIFVATHDTIGLGEDGPTHQPIEHFTWLRATPNVEVDRPCDQTETSAAWACAIESTTRPTIMSLTRQNTPHLKGSSFDGACHGAYTFLEPAVAPKLIIIATGSEVQNAVEAAALLEAKGIPTRVVSMPSTTRFDRQSDDFKRALFPVGIPILSVEAMSPLGWEKYSHYHIGMTTFGASAPADTLFEKFGFGKADIADKGMKLLQHFGDKAPSKIPLVL